MPVRSPAERTVAWGNLRMREAKCRDGAPIAPGSGLHHPIVRLTFGPIYCGLDFCVNLSKSALS